MEEVKERGPLMRFRKIVRALTSVLFLTAIIILVDYFYRRLSGHPFGKISTLIGTVGIILAFGVGIVFNHYRARRLEQSRQGGNDHG